MGYSKKPDPSTVGTFVGYLTDVVVTDTPDGRSVTVTMDVPNALGRGDSTIPHLLEQDPRRLFGLPSDDCREDPKPMRLTLEMLPDSMVPQASN